jgi:phosphohistidine phosphatase SixA
MRKTVRRRFEANGAAFAAAAAIVALAWSPSTGAQSEAEILVAGMQDGGKVIYIRHAITDPKQVDTGRLGDRAGQRNLTPAGQEQARALGRAFVTLRIPRGEILASPVFRARDTAELAFGTESVTVTRDLVADEYAGGNVRAMVAATSRLLRTLPPPGDNRILIGHRTPLEMATGQKFPDTMLPEGGMAVFHPGINGRLLGTITAERLIRSATVRR